VRTGILVSVAHLSVWVVYLSWVHRPGHGVLYLAPPDWNLFPRETIWHLPYDLLNLPVHLAYAPLGNFFFDYFRGRIYDVQLPDAEVWLNCGFHLCAFAV